MTASPIAILDTGLVTSVGLSAPASCAAIRARIGNPTETRFLGGDGEWIMAHQVALAQPWRGRTLLARMAAMAIDECLASVPTDEWRAIPLVLCVAEDERRGRLQGLDDQLFGDIEEVLAARFSPASATIAQGRVSVALALMHARALLYERGAHRVLIAATDSLVTWPSLNYYTSNDRLLTALNPNGFMAGEAAGALLVGRPTGAAQLVCSGLGFATEKAHVDSGQPLKAEGLASAIKVALAEAGCAIHQLDFRIADLSGEQYYFKEASLAVSRLLRAQKEDFQLWHPAECVGAVGAAAGTVCLAVARMAAAKGYAPGRGVMLHLGNDEGQRAAIVAFQE